MKRMLIIILVMMFILTNSVACTEEIQPAATEKAKETTAHIDSGSVNSEKAGDAASERMDASDPEAYDKRPDTDAYIRYYKKIQEAIEDPLRMNLYEGLVPPIGQAKSYVLADVKEARAGRAGFKTLDAGKISSVIPDYEALSAEESSENLKVSSDKNGRSLVLYYSDQTQKKLIGISYVTKQQKALREGLSLLYSFGLETRRAFSLPTEGDFAFKRREDAIQESEEIVRALGVSEFVLQNCYLLPREIAGEEAYYLRFMPLIDGIPQINSSLFLGNDHFGLEARIDLLWTKDGLVSLDLNFLLEPGAQTETTPILGEERIFELIEERKEMSLQEMNFEVDSIELINTNNSAFSYEEEGMSFHPYYLVVMASAQMPDGTEGLYLEPWIFDAVNGAVVW